jgi:hypothetical protein
MARRIWENFARQTTDCRLVIVENGPALGFFKGAGLPEVTVLQSEQGVGRARQVGLEFVREHKGLFLMLDDDDFYGPNYVHEFETCLRMHPEATIVGKNPHYVHLPDGKIWHFSGWAKDGRVAQLWTGATIGFRSWEAADFPDTNTANDTDWFEAMRDRDPVCWVTGEKGYVYYRGDGDNTTDAMVGYVPGRGHVEPSGPFSMAQAGIL